MVFIFLRGIEMDRFGILVFTLGGCVGAAILGWSIVMFSPTYYADLPGECESNGYVEKSGYVIKCSVINKSELIKRSL